jgi:hypothetical protein
MRRASLLRLTGILIFLSTQLGFSSRTQAAQASSSQAPYLSSQVTIGTFVDFIKPAIAYNPAHHEYLVVWADDHISDHYSIYARRISAQGKPLGSPFLVYNNTSHSAISPSVAYDPIHDRYLIVFEYVFSSYDLDIYGRLIPWSGPSSSLNAFDLASWTTSQSSAHVVYASGQQEFFMVWRNSSPGDPGSVQGKRIPLDGGSAIDPVDFSFSASSGPMYFSDITYNPALSEYLIVGFEQNSSHDIWAAFINAETGSVLAGSPFVLAGWPNDEDAPAAAYCFRADKYLVVWQSLIGGSNPNNRDIYGWFLHGAGDVDGPPVLIANTPHVEGNPSLTCNEAGDQFLLTYEKDDDFQGGNAFGTMARIIYPDQNMDASFDLDPPVWPYMSWQVIAAGGGSSYLAAWTHQISSTEWNLYGLLVTPHVSFLPLVVR